jgi:hypothetical protein
VIVNATPLRKASERRCRGKIREVRRRLLLHRLKSRYRHPELFPRPSVILKKLNASLSSPDYLRRMNQPPRRP